MPKSICTRRNAHLRLKKGERPLLLRALGLVESGRTVEAALADFSPSKRRGYPAGASIGLRRRRGGLPAEARREYSRWQPANSCHLDANPPLIQAKALGAFGPGVGRVLFRSSRAANLGRGADSARTPQNHSNGHQ